MQNLYWYSSLKDLSDFLPSSSALVSSENLDWDFSVLTSWNAMIDWEGWMKTRILICSSPIFLRVYRFSYDWRVFSFHFTWIFNETSLDFIFWCRSFFVNKRLFFFAIIFGFVFILYGVFWPKKPFFIICEEEDFLDSLFLFENEALLIVDVELQVQVNL